MSAPLKIDKKRPYVDADMLNEAKINWFGKVLYFVKHEDGLVTIEAHNGIKANSQGNTH